MAEQEVMDLPSRGASDDFGSDDFGNRDTGGEFGEQDFGGSDEPGPGQGQSKSSRRRRRKRKNKVISASGGEGGASIVIEGGDTGPVVMEGESIALAAPAPTQAPRRQSAPNAGGGQAPRQNQNQGQAQGEGGKRWKKKFRDRERRPGTGGGGRSENPGNDFRGDQNSQPSFGGGQNFGGQQQGFNGGGSNFKRKNKQGGQRKERGGFVGPMDHSYREANGNFADPSASTIQVNGGFARKGRHHGDSQPIDHNMPRAVPIPENAQTHIYFFIEDLFFTAKIQETARKQGVKVQFLKNDKDELTHLLSGEEKDKPALIVFDLNNANAKPLTLIPKLKAKLKKSASIIGFLSHLQGDLKAKAVEAGCDVVMPRAAFSQNLPNLLRRYSAEEEDEINYNQ